MTGLDVPIGNSLESLTAEVNTYRAKLFGKQVWLIDTPGFNDTNAVERSDTVVLEAVSAELLKQHQQGHGIGRRKFPEECHHCYYKMGHGEQGRGREQRKAAQGEILGSTHLPWGQGGESLPGRQQLVPEHCRGRHE